MDLIGYCLSGYIYESHLYFSVSTSVSKCLWAPMYYSVNQRICSSQSQIKELKGICDQPYSNPMHVDLHNFIRRANRNTGREDDHILKNELNSNTKCVHED